MIACRLQRTLESRYRMRLREQQTVGAPTSPPGDVHQSIG